MAEDERSYSGRIPIRLRLLFETFAGLIGAIVSFLAVADYLGGGWLGPAVTGLVFATGLVVAFLVVRWLSPKAK